jgi:glycosyltransferase involved in cell wall biosynthesis
MKIAIVEWWPRLCGAVNWAIHLSGAQTEHQVDLLTFSKSGKKLKPWDRVVADWKVHKIADAVEVLNSYDLVILSDIVCRAPETRPKVISDTNEFLSPYYLSILQQIKTPWTTMIHDGSYAGKESELMRRMLKTPSFNKTLITTRFKEAKTRIDKLESGVDITWLVDPYLPYDQKKVRTAAIPPLEKRTSEFIHIGRLSTNKGQDVMLDLARELNANTHLWGYCAYGKPSHGWLLWELATQHLGYREMIFPHTTKPQMKHPLIYKFYTGQFAVEHVLEGSIDDDVGGFVHYHGGYLDYDEIDWTPMINVALTNEGWKGTLEYATLDAIMHDCVAVVPEQQIEYADYRTLFTIPYRRCSYKVKKDQPLGGTRDWDRDAIVSKLNELASKTVQELSLYAALQKAEIISKHSPEHVLNLIVEAHGVQ